MAECELIGFWLGDGNKNVLKKGGVEYRMWQGADSPAIINRVQMLLRECGIDFVRKSIFTKNGAEVIQWSLPRGTGFGHQKRRGVFHLEPYLVKDGSPLLWGLSGDQFDALIKGLWMADGTTHGNSAELPTQRIMICGARPKQFDLLQGIAVCHGYRASVRCYKQSRSEHRLHMLSLTKEDVHHLTKYRFQLESDWKDEEVWCVETSSGNIVTRRRGSATVMGNCREGLDLPWLEVAIFATVFGSLQSYLQSGGRLLRAHPGKTHCTIIDHGGGWHAHGSLNADRTWHLEYTEAMYQGMREAQLRGKKCAVCKAPCKGPICPSCGAKNEVEPFVCPKCKQVLVTPTCPCGFQVKQRMRPVVQSDGSVKEYEGEIYKPHRVKQQDDTAKLWEKCYYRAKNSKNEMTFRQAMAMFVHDHGYYPPQGLPLMPSNDMDWYRKVCKVSYDKLIPKEGKQ